MLTDSTDNEIEFESPDIDFSEAQILLATALEIDPMSITSDRYDSRYFNIAEMEQGRKVKPYLTIGKSYMVLTDSEANDQVRNQVKDWQYNVGSFDYSHYSQFFYDNAFDDYMQEYNEHTIEYMSNEEVLNELRNDYGLEYSEVTDDNIDDYEDELRERLLDYKNSEYVSSLDWLNDKVNNREIDEDEIMYLLRDNLDNYVDVDALVDDYMDCYGDDRGYWISGTGAHELELGYSNEFGEDMYAYEME